MEFIQAKWYHTGRQGKSIRLIVIHSMEAPEKGTTAEGTARYFQRGERKASAHYCFDNNSGVQCVKDSDTAFGAAGANTDGIHFEQAGYAKQSQNEWLDQFDKDMWKQMAPTLQRITKDNKIPWKWLTVAEVADGKTKGFCTHADVSKAFPKVSTGHYDPGPNFPKQEAMKIWQDNSDSEEDDMTTGTNYILEANCVVEGRQFLKGQFICVIGNVRREATPDRHDELIRQWGQPKPINVVAFEDLVASTALNMLGLRSLTPAQTDQLGYIFDQVGGE